MVRRRKTMRFLGGFYAFPGGKVDSEDGAMEVLGRCRGITAAEAERLVPSEEGLPSLAFWVAAARELLEETGVLPACDRTGRPIACVEPGAVARIEAFRGDHMAKRAPFAALLEAEDWYLDLGPFRYLSHFITPPSSPIRFSARFFLCPLPAGQAPRLILEEASEGRWVAPAEAHARFRAGEWPMAEPAEYGTQYLAQFPSYAALWSHHRDGQPKVAGIIDRLDAARHYQFDWDTVVHPRA